MDTKEPLTVNTNSQENTDNEPQVFATSETGNEGKFTRRNFLELAAASTAAATLASCGSSQGERDALATEIASNIFATQTAEAQIKKTPESSSATPTDRPESSSATSTDTPKSGPFHAIVNRPQVKLYAGPDAATKIVATEISNGTVLDILARNDHGTWLKVKTKEGNVGWLPKGTIDIDAPIESMMKNTPIENNAATSSPPTDTPMPNLPRGVVDATSALLRASPDVTADAVVLGLVSGTALYVLARNESGTWFLVQTEKGERGWIHKSSIKIEASFSSSVQSFPVSNEIAPRPTAKRPPADSAPAAEPGATVEVHPTVKPRPTVKPLPTPKPPSQPSFGHYWYPN